MHSLSNREILMWLFVSSYNYYTFVFDGSGSCLGVGFMCTLHSCLLFAFTKTINFYRIEVVKMLLTCVVLAPSKVLWLCRKKDLNFSAIQAKRNFLFVIAKESLRVKLFKYNSCHFDVDKYPWLGCWQ